MVDQKITHKLWEKGDWRLEYVSYAFEKWWLNFVALLEAENGLWTIDRQSNCVDDNWIREPSFWFCQIHKWYHPEIVNDPKFFTDWKWQIDRCHELYVGWTPFYWKSNIAKTKQRFELF